MSRPHGLQTRPGAITEAYVEDRQRYFPVDYSDALWRQMRDLALEHADRFDCALPYPFIAQGLLTGPLGLAALEPLRYALLDRYASHIRAGRGRDFNSLFLSFRLDDRVRDYVRSRGRLEDWDWRRGQPEDPALYAGDSPLLTTDSPNRCITVYADRTEYRTLAQAGIRLVEPLGAVAEPWPTP